jgi:hypothetical protein
MHLQPESPLSSLEQTFEAFFEEVLVHQQNKVLEIARTLNPHLTADDILNPHDFPELMTSPVFQYEEGIATGLLAAQIALRSRLFRKQATPSPESTD